MYHADFEKNIRGTITTVTDDPEMKRVKEVASVISQAAYTRGRSNSENTDLEHRICKSVACRWLIVLCAGIFFAMNASQKTLQVKREHYHPSILAPQKVIKTALL